MAESPAATQTTQPPSSKVPRKVCACGAKWGKHKKKKNRKRKVGCQRKEGEGSWRPIFNPPRLGNLTKDGARRLALAVDSKLPQDVGCTRHGMQIKGVGGGKRKEGHFKTARKRMRAVTPQTITPNNTEESTRHAGEEARVLAAHLVHGGPVDVVAVEQILVRSVLLQRLLFKQRLLGHAGHKLCMTTKRGRGDGGVDSGRQ